MTRARTSDIANWWIFNATKILVNTYFSILSNGCLKHVQLASNNLAICLVAIIRSLAAREDIIIRRKDKGSHYLTNAPRNRRQTFLLFSSFHFFKFLFLFLRPFSASMFHTRHTILSWKHMITPIQLVRSITSRYYRLQLHHGVIDYTPLRIYICISRQNRYPRVEIMTHCFNDDR